jgi:hypothetical protein
VAAAVALMPLLIWYDYLRSIYRSTLLAGTDSLVLPGTGIGHVWRGSFIAVIRGGLLSSDASIFGILFALVTQAVYVIARREYAVPWWRIAVIYAMLMLVLGRDLAHPLTGAITRVLLPMTVGFNILLMTEQRNSRFWSWFAAGNLHLLPAIHVMPLLG